MPEELWRRTRTWSIRSAVALAMLAIWLGSPMPEAEAAPPQQTLVPLKVVSDVLDDTLLRALTQVLVGRLQAYPRYEVLPTPEMDLLEALMEMDCVEPDVECLGAIGRREGAAMVLFVTVTRKDSGGFALAYELIDARQGVLEKGGERTASSTAALAGEMERVILDAFGEPPPPPPREVDVTVEVNVPSARVYIDDRDIGIAPVRTELMPGRHVLRVSKQGYVEYRETIFVEQDRPFTRVISLKPRQVEAPTVGGVTPTTMVDGTAEEGSGESEAKPFYTQWWFWTGAGAIVAAAVTSAILLSGSSSSSRSTGGVVLSLDPAQVENDAIFQAP